MINMTNNEKIKPDKVIDCIGLYCPMPLFTISQEIENIEIGQVLELIADDPASYQDIPRWSKRTGHELIEKYEKDGEYHFLIRKCETASE